MYALASILYVPAARVTLLEVLPLLRVIAGCPVIVIWYSNELIASDDGIAFDCATPGILSFNVP
jgi:hypothetical protein